MKEAIIARMLEGDETVTDIQRDTRVGIDTLYRWRDQAKHQKGLSATTKYKNADKWSSQDKFMVVLETANLTEIEFPEYCREKGVYPEQHCIKHAQSLESVNEHITAGRIQTVII